MTDPRPAFITATDLASTVIDGVRPNQRTNPTPCGDFDVAAMIEHLRNVMPRVAAAGRGGDPMAIETSDLSWTDGVADAIAAWADGAALDQPTKVPWAPDSGREALAGWVMELTVHTWDLAQATGQTPAWDAEVSQVALDSPLRSFPRTGRRELFLATAGVVPFEDAVDVPGDAPLIEQVVALSGRDPRWPATS